MPKTTVDHITECGKAPSMKFTVIVVFDDPTPEFLQHVRNLYDFFSSKGETFELLCVANGSGALLRNVLGSLPDDGAEVRGLALKAKTTEAVCLMTAARESKGEIFVVSGPYQQITNHSLLALLEALDEETDIVTPCREKRIDSLFNRIQSKLFNAIVRVLTGSRFHDLSCTIRVFRREVMEETKIYGNMYRFIPILAQKKGFKVKEINCEHFQRDKGVFYKDIQKFSNYVTRLVDLFVLYFNTGFTRKPLRFFSSIGLFFVLGGLLIGAYIFVEKFFFGHPVGGRPLLLLGLLFIVMGVQVASVGLLGEIIAFTHGRQRKEYTVEKVI